MYLQFDNNLGTRGSFQREWYQGKIFESPNKVEIKQFQQEPKTLEEKKEKGSLFESNVKKVDTQKT